MEDLQASLNCGPVKARASIGKELEALEAQCAARLAAAQAEAERTAAAASRTYSRAGVVVEEHAADMEAAQEVRRQGLGRQGADAAAGVVLSLCSPLLAGCPAGLQPQCDRLVKAERVTLGPHHLAHMVKA